LDLRDKRELYNGFGDTLAKAVEFVVTPMLFGFGGHLLDGWLGTGVVFTALLAVFALVGTSVRMYYSYEAAMKAHEADSPWAGRSRARAAGPRP
jgi:lysozyme family protein